MSEDFKSIKTIQARGKSTRYSEFKSRMSCLTEKQQHLLEVKGSHCMNCRFQVFQEKIAVNASFLPNCMLSMSIKLH